jgi:O-antigen/teichoic acid export membrane protein
MFKSIIKQYLTYGAGNLAQQLLGFLLIPIYLRLFTPAEFGIIATLLVIQTLLILITTSGINNGLMMLYYDVDTRVRKQLVGNTWLWYLGGAVLGILIFSVPAKPLSSLLFGSAEYGYTLQLLGIYMGATLLTEVPLTLLRMEKQAGRYVFLSLLRFAADLTLKIVLIVSLERGVNGFFESGLLANILVLVLALPLVYRYVSFKPNYQQLKKLARLGAPLIIGALAVWTLSLSDRLILNYFHGTAFVGIYGAANTVANLFNILLYTPFVLFWNPFFLSYASDNVIHAARELLARTVGYAVLLGGLITLVISLGVYDLIRILIELFAINEEYLAAAPLVPWLTFGLYFFFLQVILGSALYAVKKPRYLAVAGFSAAILNLGLNFFFIPRFGAFGAAVTTLTGFAVMLVLVYIWSRRHFDVSYPWRRLVMGLAVTAGALAIGMQLDIASPWASIFARVFTGVALFGVYGWFFSGLLRETDKRALIDQVRRRPSAFRKSHKSEHDDIT